MAGITQARRDLHLDPLFIHAVYLINLASPNPLLRRRSTQSLIKTLEAGHDLRALGIITHIGSHGGLGFDAVAGRIADGLTEILEETPEDVDLILENSAGAGGIVGSTLEEISDLMSRTGWPNRLKFALDTAHLCASGHDFTQPETAENLVRSAQKLIGTDRLAVIHANDSKVKSGSRRDRHANVGDGYITRDGFRSLLRQEALRQVPWVLETPDLEASLPEGERFTSIQVLRDLAIETSLLSTLSPIAHFSESQRRF
ncbi:MAG: hypothetical protein NVSMB52_07730 [Chloroflexota bacterium]